MIIVSLSKHLEIKAKHTVTLLANGNKVLIILINESILLMYWSKE